MSGLAELVTGHRLQQAAGHAEGEADGDPGKQAGDAGTGEDVVDGHARHGLRGAGCADSVAGEIGHPEPGGPLGQVPHADEHRRHHERDDGADGRGRRGGGPRPAGHPGAHFAAATALTASTKASMSWIPERGPPAAHRSLGNSWVRLSLTAGRLDQIGFSVIAST